MYYVVLHPWRSAPAGDLTLALDPAQPSLHLVALAAGADAQPGRSIEPARIVGKFTLHQSPDPRIPEVAAAIGRIVANVWPAWLDARILELLNGIGGLGTLRGAAAHRAAMHTMDRSAPPDLGHPLGSLGIWGGHVQTVQREVHGKGRFKGWADLKARLDPMLVQGIRDAVPAVLRDDLLGVSSPRLLLRERI